MEININFVLFEEPKDKPGGNGTQARIVILRESRDVDSALNSAEADLDSPE